MIRRIVSICISCMVLMSSGSVVFANQKVEQWTKDRKVFLSDKEIGTFNNRMNQPGTDVTDLSKMPETLTGSNIKKRIETYTITYPYSKRGYVSAKVRSYYNSLRNLSLIDGSKKIKLKYALITQPLDLRQYPTDDWLHSAKSSSFDRFQEAMVQVGQGACIMHYSKDGKWAFVQTKIGYGWIKSAGLAKCSKKQMTDYINDHDFYIVTKKATGTLAGKKRTLLMGTKLLRNADGQAVIPQRNAKGMLSFKTERLSSRFPARRGYMPVSRYLVINQAYKFAGTKYGWGMKNYLQDCSSTMSSIYSVFGITLPRDTSRLCKAKGKISVTGKSNAKKTEVIRKQKPGALLFYKGHVMMYLGYKNKKIYILHNRWPKCVAEPMPSWRLTNVTYILGI